LLSASGAAPVRELVARLDGCTGGRAGEIVAKAGLVRMACSTLSSEQTVRLLEVARDNARKVKPERLGAVGPELFPDRAYGMSSGVAPFGARPHADVPFVVEAWAAENPDMRSSSVSIAHRSPATSMRTAEGSAMPSVKASSGPRWRYGPGRNSGRSLPWAWRGSGAKAASCRSFASSNSGSGRHRAPSTSTTSG
jgi:hypothetical protein